MKLFRLTKTQSLLHHTYKKVQKNFKRIEKQFRTFHKKKKYHYSETQNGVLHLNFIYQFCSKKVSWLAKSNWKHTWGKRADKSFKVIKALCTNISIKQHVYVLWTPLKLKDRSLLYKDTYVNDGYFSTFHNSIKTY